ncbi:MAG: YggS family pyridoxal phosphate-dependent enzyme [Anaerolineae bacterium]
MSDLKQQYTAVQTRINHTAEKAGRDPAAITLVAVTKTWPVATTFAAYEAGMRHFGENRAEELAKKRTAVEEQLGADNGITWHLIGTLQSRKTALAAEHADAFHALDRLKIANRLSNHLSTLPAPRPPLPVFLEVNISGEGSKSGWQMSDWEQDATQRGTLRNAAQAVAGLPHLRLAGLMTMAPWGAADSVIQTVFRRTRLLAEWLADEMGRERPLALSMGMTDDFELAVAAGATHVRVGRAIFGSRG